MPLSYRFRQFIWSGLDWLFPPVCGGCNRVGFRWCPDCQNHVTVIQEPICRKCGLPLPIPGHCESCRKSTPPYEIMRSWAVFDGPIRQALHQIKYYRNISLADELSKRLAEYVVNLNWQVDAVVPVPLGKERKKERGYNQVGLVAMALAEVNHWRYIPQAVVRSRETRSQVGLSSAERKEYVSAAFCGEAAIVSKTSILLVDDVATTGATLSACAEALLEAGARSVYALTIARALPHQVFNIV